MINIKKIRIKHNTSITFYEGCEEYILNCKSRNLRQATIRHYEESFKNLNKYIECYVNEITLTTFNEFMCKMYEEDLASQTVHSYSRDLKTLLNYFMNHNYMPTFKISLPKVDKTPIETYSDDELKKLLKKPNLNSCSFVEYRDYVIVNFLLSTGLRSNSLINIKIKDIDFYNELIYVNTTKNRKPLVLPLNKTILKILKEFLKIRQGMEEDYLFPTAFGEQMKRKTLNQALNIYANNRGVNTTGVHRYRHTFAKKFILQGGNVVILSKILGHSDLKITQNYLNILTTDIKREVDKINILDEFDNNNFIKMK